MSSKGYTLLEVLVVLVILGMVFIIGSNMFFSILKGSTKTRVLSEAKQNGSYVLGVMERMIRNARSVDGWDNSTGTWIRIRNPDDQETTFRCSSGFIASESSTLIGASARLTSERVQVVSCNGFVDYSNPSSVVINFSLTFPGSASHPEETATVNFSTRVTLRN